MKIRTKMVCAGCYRYELMRDGEVVDTVYVERGMEPGPAYWTTSIHDLRFATKGEARDVAVMTMRESAEFDN
jgi:hypothetical protein